MLILIPCPQCQMPAEVQERFWLTSTDGDVEHIVVRCLSGHHFRMALDRLPMADQSLLDGSGSTCDVGLAFDLGIAAD